MKKIIADFQTAGGKHCITNSMKQIFHYNNCPLSEEMLFGLGEGLDFTYINLSHAPMVSGRTKVFDFEQALSRNLGMPIRCKKSGDNQKIFEAAKKQIDQGQPVLVYVDMPFLPYLSMGEESHFGGHAIVLFGYDEEQGCFYVSDRDNGDYPIRIPGGSIASDYHMVGFNEMEQARSSTSRPFPARNQYLEFGFSPFQGIKQPALIRSIFHVCRRMLYPGAKLKGVCGIDKFSKGILRWKSFDEEKRKRAGITNYFQIHKDGGSGGGIFRDMYGIFLIEAAEILACSPIREIGIQFKALSKQWDYVAEEMWKLSQTGDIYILYEMSVQIAGLYEAEQRLLSELYGVLIKDFPVSVESLQNVRD